MKTVRWILTSLFAATAASSATGCLTEDVPIGTDTDGAGMQTWTAPVDVVEGYGFCSDNLNGTCSAGWEGHTIMMTSPGQDGSDCYCPRECKSAANCPTPDTGTAVPECATSADAPSAMCVLPCADGQTCPEGMTCRSTLVPDLGAICVWYDEPSDIVRMNPEVCGERATEQACEAVLSDYPVAPNYRCGWAKETLIPRDDAACDVPIVREKCVAVQVEATADICEAGRNCDGSPGALFWADVGAGDISLLELESCDQRPHTTGSPDYQSCNFAAMQTAPTVCDCACSE